MASDIVLRALGQAWKCLDAFPGRKAVFGGLALSAWNHSRSTNIRCEDLIVMKLRAGRLIDRADVVALLAANLDSLDFGHLATWVRRFGLQQKFRESWTEAFPGRASPI